MVSLVMVVRNEAHRIVAALESAKSVVSQVVIVDQQSTDTTVQTCLDWLERSDIRHIVERSEQVGYCELSRQEALELATEDWILWLDGDELLSEKLQADLPHYLDTSLAGWFIRRRNEFHAGTRVWSTVEDNQLRLARRRCLPPQSTAIHTTLQVHGLCGLITAPLLHPKTMGEVWSDVQRYEGVAAGNAALAGAYYPAEWHPDVIGTVKALLETA